MTGVLLITGGASGIGAETARRAAKKGYKVAINYRSRDAQAMGLAADIAAQDGEAIALPGDMASEADIVRLFTETERTFGPVTHLVNSAGISRQMRVDEYDAKALAGLFATNVIGLMLCCREAARRMSTTHGGKGGAIVNVSSAAAKLGSPGDYVDYAASKAAIETFTVGLAKEVGGEGIRVNCVRPGVIRTDIHLVSGDPSRVERIGGAAPLGRPGEPEEVARAILFLASDEASYTTGSVLDVTGGR
jgi:NAD(P)-dependent dehydrogenase (short-subunit alcohol dehydrogenase family)